MRVKVRTIMIKSLISFLFLVTVVFAEDIPLSNEVLDDYDVEAQVDCLILQDENSIICKFESPRNIKDEQIIVQWIDPQGDISRSRDMLVPAGHGSIYDYRYINGRLLGIWTFKVISNDKEYSTQFELK